MKSYTASTIMAALVAVSSSALAQSVDLGVEAATDGIASSTQSLTSGVIEIGWLNPGVTQGQIVSLFTANNLVGIDAVFNQVASVAFPSGGLDFDSGGGQYFENVTLVANGDAPGLTAYKNVTTGAAGKQMFSWVRNSASIAGTTEMAFVNGNLFFPTANDTVNFTDFGGTFAHSNPPATAWVGTIAPVTVNSQIDNLGAGNIAGDGFGATGSGFVLELAAPVPEPGTALFALVGLTGMALRRHRKSVRA